MDATNKSEQRTEKIQGILGLLMILIGILAISFGVWQSHNRPQAQDPADKWATALCEQMKMNRGTDHCSLERYGTAKMPDGIQIQFVVFETFYSEDVAEAQGMATHRYSPWTLYIMNDEVVHAE